jgi:hypothetical protein
MKFTRSRVLVTLLVLGLIVLYANLLSSYVNHNKTQAALQDQIDSAVTMLNLLPSAPVDSQKRLDEAQKAYDAALAAIADNTVDSNQIMETTIKTAAECNIKVNPTTTDQWTERTIGLNSYRILPLTLDIKGKHADIITFIQRLENRDQFPNLAIGSLILTEAPSSPGTTGDYQQATLNTNIIVRLAPGS